MSPEHEAAVDTPGPAAAGEPPHEAGAPDVIVARAALLAGLCRLVPLPFVDELLLRQALAHLVGSLLTLHGHPASAPHARPLYDDPGGCLTRAAWFLVTLPFRLVFKLIAKLFKTVFFFLALRDAALQVGRAALLGRSLDQALRAGLVPAPSGPPTPGDPCWVASVRLRGAFDRAFAGSDWRLLQQAVLGALRGVKGLARLGLGVARGLRRAGPEHATVAEDVAALPPEERARVEGLAGAVQTALDAPEVAGYLADFDRRFSEAWTALDAPASPA